MPSFILINADKNDPISTQELPEQRKSRIHHAQPLVVS